MRNTFKEDLYNDAKLTLPKPSITLERASVICALAALRVVETGKCRKSDCQEALQRFYGQLRSNTFMALMEVRDNLAALDKSPLVPFLECVHNLLPGFISAQKKIDKRDDDFIRTALIEFSNQGLMQEYFYPWPEVQKWVESAVDAILTPLGTTLPTQMKSGRAAADLCVTSQLLVAQSTCVLFDYFYNMDACKSNTVLCGVESYAITEIETSIMAGVMRQVLGNLSRVESDAFVSRCRELASKELKLWRVMDCEFDDLVAMLGSFLTMRHSIKAIAGRNRAFLNLDTFPEQLKKFSVCQDVNVTSSWPRDLPVGEVVIVMLEKDDFLITKYDGRKGLIHVGVTTGDLSDQFCMDRCCPATAETTTAVINGMMGACLDQRGDLLSSSDERLLIPPRHCHWYDQTLTAIRTIEAVTYPILQQEWQLHPALFSSLSDSSPIMIIVSGQERLLAVEKGFASAQDFEIADFEGLNNIFSFLHSSGTEIRCLAEMPVDLDVSALKDENDKTAWQRIFCQLPGGKLSFEWLCKRLELHGVEIVPDGGKGSHYKLIRKTPDGTLSHPVSKRFRREVNAANFLREIVVGLGISLDEFADSLY